MPDSPKPDENMTITQEQMAKIVSWGDERVALEYSARPVYDFFAAAFAVAGISVAEEPTPEARVEQAPISDEALVRKIRDAAENGANECAEIDLLCRAATRIEALNRENAELHATRQTLIVDRRNICSELQKVRAELSEMTHDRDVWLAVAHRGGCGQCSENYGANLCEHGKTLMETARPGSTK